MSEAFDLVYRSVEEQHADKPASTRRAFVAGAATTLGGMGLLAMPGAALAKDSKQGGNDPQTILNVAATAEVLATIVNTVGYERGLGKDPVTQRNIKAAAREELVHYQVLVASGGKPVTTKIWVPNAVFASRTGLLNTLQVGDQIFVNAYLIATKTFGNLGNGALAVTTAEFMGVEAVHRALARQSLGQLGNDRVFCKFDQREEAPGAPNRGQPGFEDILDAVTQLRAAGFGFGTEGAKPGQFYDFGAVSKRTPTDPDLNTFRPDAS
ncbi:MAG: ferritin-like domain-containing protein [Actinomycetota bacterium]|nr:ferritin-like domain-containing protein [Actinomycetota bacterium]